MLKSSVNKIKGGHSPVIIKFPDFFLTFPDISSDYLRGIDPRNSSNKNEMHVIS